MTSRQRSLEALGFTGGEQRVRRRPEKQANVGAPVTDEKMDDERPTSVRITVSSGLAFNFQAPSARSVHEALAHDDCALGAVMTRTRSALAEGAPTVLSDTIMKVLEEWLPFETPSRPVGRGVLDDKASARKALFTLTRVAAVSLAERLSLLSLGRRDES